MAQKAPALPLTAGDVIKTHPRDGFWGCAIVLKTHPRTDRFLAMASIGITPLVFRHDFEWRDIAKEQVTILKTHRGYVGNDHRIEVTCIGTYVAKAHPALPTIGRIDPKPVFTGALGTEPGDGTADK